MIDFSIFVKKLLLDKHMTLTQLGEHLAMDRKEISRYMLRDDFRINADIIRIAAALGLEVSLALIDPVTGERYEVK